MTRSGRFFLGTIGLWLGTAVASSFAGHGSGGPLLAIPPEYVKRLIDAGEQIVFVDLRPAAQFEGGRLPGARSVPLSELERRFAEVPRTGRVLLYCTCPPEDELRAYQFLRTQGYRNIAVLQEGFPGWVKRGYEVQR